MQYISLALVGILICVSACKSVKDDAPANEDSVQLKGFVNTVPAEKDCYYPRKTIRTLTNQQGTIVLFSNEYLIALDSADSNGEKYIVCELPSQFQKNGLSVIFSGDKLEVMPHEKRFAIPLRLKSMHLPR